MKVVTAYAESAGGPGWANYPLWVIVDDGLGNLNTECIQPEEQTDAMRLLYWISAAVHKEMRWAAEEVLRKRK